MKNQVKVSPSEKAKKIAESKAKTMETRAENRKANKAKRNPVKAEKDGIVYLKEGVTSAQFYEAKKATNNAVKEERAKISRVLSDAFNNDKGYFESINMSKRALKNTMSPEVILMHATNYQLVCYYNALMDKGYIRFNVWWSLDYIKHELNGKDINPIAEQFFKQLVIKNGNFEIIDEAELERVFKKAVKAVAKAKAEREAKEQAKK